jgi:hypothetical protein
MSQTIRSGWLDPPVDNHRDHVLGLTGADITLSQTMTSPAARPNWRNELSRTNSGKSTLP